MGFRCAIVGLPNVGKSTLFNALTSGKAQAENYPFCTVDPNIGRVAVPDARLETLKEGFHSQKIVPTFMEFVDIAGLVKGASRGEGLGNQFLGHIRSTDAMAHVVRCFEDLDITHVEGGVHPLRDLDIIETELALADFETVQKQQTRYEKLLKTQKPEVLAIHAMLGALHDHLQGLNPARTFSYAMNEEIRCAFRDLHLLTAKPAFYICNVKEMGQSPWVEKVRTMAREKGTLVVEVSGKWEAELSELELPEREELLKELGWESPGLHRLIRVGYELLGLQTYFTAGPKEIHAWTIPLQATARQAAGVIHSDFAKGFICAEVFHFNDFLKFPSKPALKESGLLRIEGRDYKVQDGDVMEFRFNV